MGVRNRNRSEYNTVVDRRVGMRFRQWEEPYDVMCQRGTTSSQQVGDRVKIRGSGRSGP